MAARTMGTFWGQSVQGTGISGAGLAVLRVLAARNGLKSSEVAARGWSTPGTVTTVVDTLVRDGLVRRERDYTDRRVVRLFVTERGMDKLIETLAEVGPRWRAPSTTSTQPTSRRSANSSSTPSSGSAP